MTGTLYQTKSGRKRLLDELGELKKKETELTTARGKRHEIAGRQQNFEDVDGSNLDNDLTACIARMSEINKALMESRPDPAPDPTDVKKVSLGCIVSALRFENDQDETGTPYRFKLVGHGEGMLKGCPSEPDPKLPLISYTCPLGAAAIGKRVGRSFEVNGKEYEIQKIELPPKPVQAANAA